MIHGDQTWPLSSRPIQYFHYKLKSYKALTPFWYEKKYIFMFQLIADG